MQTQILAPAAVLIAWSLVMLLWMAATRLPALAKLKMSAEQSRGGRGSDLDAVLPRELQWKAHNYNHLMEQPTIFYALVLILALAGFTLVDLILAWAYVVLRVIHSIWQAVVNTIPVRLTIFAVSSAVLIGLSARTLWVTLG